MTWCDDCAASTETNGHWPRHNAVQCIYCTARYIHGLGQLKTLAKPEITAWQRRVLKEAIDYGHSEIEIRRLEKSGPWVQPIEAKPTKRKG